VARPDRTVFRQLRRDVRDALDVRPKIASRSNHALEILVTDHEACRRPLRDEREAPLFRAFGDVVAWLDDLAVPVVPRVLLGQHEFVFACLAMSGAVLVFTVDVPITI